MFGKHCTRASCEPLNVTAEVVLEGNPDIAGIGVLVGFLGTAYTTFLLFLAAYLIVYNPDEDANPANLIDNLFLGHCRGLASHVFGSLKLPRPRLHDILMSCIMSMCDIQVITGLGILAGGVASLDCSSLTAYHWGFIVNLAWFSSVTHLSGLSALRSHLHSYTWETRIRLAFMFALLICLVIAMIPTILFNWEHVDSQSRYLTVFDAVFYTSSQVNDYDKAIWSAALPGSPAWCFFDIHKAKQHWSIRQEQACQLMQENGDEYPSGTLCGGGLPTLFETSAAQSMVFSTSLLVFGFVARIIRLVPSMSRFINNGTRAPISRGFVTLEMVLVQRQRKSRCPYFLIFLHRIVAAIHLTLRFYLELFLSKLGELFWLMLLLVWGTMDIVKSRSNIPQAVADVENEWSFGQVLPAALLVAPLYAMALQFVTAAEDRERNRSGQKEPQQLLSMSGLGVSEEAKSRAPINQIDGQSLSSANLVAPLRSLAPSGAASDSEMDSIVLNSMKANDRAQSHMPTMKSPGLEAGNKALKWNFIPGTTATILSSTFAIICINGVQSGRTMAPWDYGLRVLAFQFFCEQPVASVLYHLMILTFIQGEDDDPSSWAKMLGLNLYGLTVYLIMVSDLVIISLTINIKPPDSVRYGEYLAIFFAFFLVDLGIWVFVLKRGRKRATKRQQDYVHVTIWPPED